MAEKRALTREDYERLQASYVSREIADAAGLYRVASLDGRELIGRKGGGEFDGIVFPYFRKNKVVAHRLRLDHPPMVNGKPDHKYLQPPGSGNKIYFPPAPLGLLDDPKVPVVITEGEKKALALWRMALETGNGSGVPTFLPIAFSGVNSWYGVIGKTNDAAGQRVDEKGPIPDLDLIAWKGRRVTILYDTNAASNWHVSKARRDLAAELTKRGAEVWIADLPPGPGVNGCDDYLGLHGVPALEAVIGKARRYAWRENLMKNEEGKAHSILKNAVIALEHAPEWAGVLAYDEFRMRHLARCPTPWGKAGDWDDSDDIQMACWFQQNGMLRISVRTAADAASIAAKENPFHPVRDYLNGLAWDGTKRLEKWLSTYLDAKETPLVLGIGKAWMISAVARIFQPGCKADQMLILEGPQGTFKSTALRRLASPWFTDDLPTLSNKDAQLATLGAWIIEMAELDAMNRSEWSKTKQFLSCQIDRFRPPYGRSMIDHARECVFAGTINHPTYLSDDTGGRRFWPVRCGQIQLDALTRDRDQLWAEAIHCYRAKQAWWLDASLDFAVREEQEERFQADAWEGVIAKALDKEKPDRVSVQDVLQYLDKPKKDWGRSDEMRISQILRRLGWRRGLREKNIRYYYPPDECPERRPEVGTAELVDSDMSYITKE